MTTFYERRAQEYQDKKRRRRKIFRRVAAASGLMIIIVVVFTIMNMGQTENYTTMPGDENIAQYEETADANNELAELYETEDTAEQQQPVDLETRANINIAIDPYCPFFEPEMPILVNRNNPIPADFNPDLVSIGDGFYLNRRAAAAWHAMQAAARRDGISLWVLSAHRSHARQETNFNNRVQRHIEAGRTPEEARELTARYIAIPGTSEHQLGKAIDVNDISAAFYGTRAFNWIIENGADFGFIFRYPRDKEHITYIAFEPWHFRYVGSNHARIIMDMGIVLEQYVERFGN